MGKRDTNLKKGEVTPEGIVVTITTKDVLTEFDLIGTVQNIERQIADANNQISHIKSTVKELEKQKEVYESALTDLRASTTATTTPIA